MSRSAVLLVVIALLAGLAIWYLSPGFLDAPLETKEEQGYQGPCPGPGPCPRPQPAPNQKMTKVLVVIAQEEHSARLKKEWPRDCPYPVEWWNNTQELTNRYRIIGTPTLLGIDSQGIEVKRQLGYLTPEQLRSWLGF